MLIMLYSIMPAFAGTGDIVGVSIEPNGWVAQVEVENFSTNAYFTANLGASNVVSAQTPYITMDAYGYDDNGNRTTIQRKVYMTALLRRPYPNQLANSIVPNGNNAVFRVALSENVYVGDSNLLATIPTNCFFTTNATTNCNGAIAMSVVNNATAVYPRVICMWTDYPYRLAGSNYTVRCKAAHISAQQFRPVRMVEFWAKDAAGNSTPTNKVLSPVIDWSYGDAVPVSEYITTLDYSSLAQGSKVSNYFRAYPWFGNVLDASDGAHPENHPDYGPFVVTCDKSNLWHSVYAIVDPVGGTSGGKAVTTLAEAIDGTAKPYATLAQAINAVALTNNAVFGSNTHENCFILLTNGNYALFGGETLATKNNPCTWTTIKPRPDVDWTTVFINTNIVNQTGQKTLKLKFENINFNWVNNAALLNQGYGSILFDQCHVWTNTTAGAYLFNFQTNAWVWRSQFDRLRPAFTYNSSYAGANVRVRGCTFYGQSGGASSTAHNPVMWIGNKCAYNVPEQLTIKNDNISPACDPFMWCDNVFLNVDASVYTLMVGIAADLNVGGCIANNVLEVGKHGYGVPFDVMYSQKDNEHCTNLLVWHNTMLSHYHPPYNLAGYQNVSCMSYQDINNIIGDWTQIGDINDFNGANSGNTNRWDRQYMVNNSGNAAAEIDNSISAPDDAANLGFGGLSWYRTTNYATHFNFINNQTYGATTNGNGNYHLRSDSVLFKLKLEKQPLPFDVDGLHRSLSDPPGAYSSGNVRKGNFF